MPDANQEIVTNTAATEEQPVKHAYAHLAEGSATEEPVDEVDEHAEGETEGEGKRRSKPIQPRINELVRKQRDAEREAAYWRGVAQGKTPNAPPPPASPPAQASKPVKESFQTYDEYVEALSEWKADIKVQAALSDVNARIEKRESQQTAAQIQENRSKNWKARAEATREILTDFDEVLSAAEGAKIEAHTAELLEDSPHGPAIAYKLAKDPELLDKLNKLSPTAAAKEFGKMEAVFDGPPTKAAATPNPNASKAPKPPTAVNVRSSTTKDPAKMSMDEYVAWRKTQK